MAEHDSSEKSKIPATVGKERKDGKSSAGLSVERPAKRAKLLDDSSSESNGEEEWNGVSSDGGNGRVSLKINEEYARRFEHNKKREERQRCKLDTGTPILLKLLMKFSGGKVR
jgi:protein KRI1